MRQQQKDLVSSRENTKKISTRLPIVILKNGEKRDAAMLATIITNPIFEMGIKNHKLLNVSIINHSTEKKFVIFKYEKNYFQSINCWSIHELCLS